MLRREDPFVAGPFTPVFRTWYRRLNENGEWDSKWPHHPFQFETYDHQLLAEHMQAFNKEFGDNPKIQRINQGMVRNRQGVMYSLSDGGNHG